MALIKKIIIIKKKKKKKKKEEEEEEEEKKKKKKKKVRPILDLLFTFYSHRYKNTKIPSVLISLTVRMLLTIFFAKIRIYHVWFLFGVTPKC